jgi:superoxide dismutase, Cu-Zn family
MRRRSPAFVRAPTHLATRAASIRTRLRCALALATVAALAGGCQMAQQASDAVTGVGPGVEARFIGAGGSVVTGAAVLRPYDGGVIMMVNFGNVGPGPYRVAIHANGNCSSPNAFSAGPPWAPAGHDGPVPILRLIKTDDLTANTIRLPGYRIDGPDGIMGRSVIVHSGAQGSLEAQPGVPNNRVACGVIGPLQSMF